MSAAAELEKKVFAKIDEMENELVRVALDLGDIDASLPARDDGSPTKRGSGDIKYHERRAAEHVESWLIGNGFETKRQGAPDRFNVLGILRGTGEGRSVVFNSHLDIAIREGMEWNRIDPEALHRVGAWRDGDSLVGIGVANCKGPMACWMLAAKAIKDTGVTLPGDMLMSAVVGETEGAPVDEFESPKWDSHELGARYAASHGAIADYALVAEATAFTIVPMMTGLAYFKITIHAGPGTSVFFLQPEESLETSVNAIHRMAKFIERFAEYSNEYRERETYSFDGITVMPRGQIGAIRGGIPGWPISSPELCSVYAHFTVAPATSPLDIQRDLEGIVAELGMEGRVEMYKHLPGREGWRNEGFATLKGAIVDSHTRMFGEPPKDPPTQFVSMWRDVNPYNEIGVPAVSYGFPTGYTHAGATHSSGSANATKVKIADMVTAAKLYASVALDLCSRSKNDPP